eukprot:m.17090 g.17090  ORF g.17090 m.17090 type:complete len:647 (+) comp4725_c0_seq1:50-1990(+)
MPITELGEDAPATAMAVRMVPSKKEARRSVGMVKKMGSITNTIGTNRTANKALVISELKSAIANNPVNNNNFPTTGKITATFQVARDVDTYYGNNNHLGDNYISVSNSNDVSNNLDGRLTTSTTTSATTPATTTITAATTAEEIQMLKAELKRLDKVDAKKRNEEMRKMDDLKKVREELHELSSLRQATVRKLEAAVEQQHQEKIMAHRREEEEKRMQIAMERKILEEEKKQWEEASNKFSEVMPKGRRVHLQFFEHKFVVQLNTLLSSRGGGHDSFFNKMFSGRLNIEHEDSTYFFDRDGRVFAHVLNFLKGKKVSKNLPPHDFEQLLDDAVFYEIWGLVAELNKDIVPFRIGGQTFPLNKREVLASCGQQSRIGKMVLGDLVEPPFVMEARDPQLFKKYILKKVKDRSFLINSRRLSDDDVALILGEEEFYGVKLLRSSLIPQAILFESGNNCIVQDYNITKSSGRKGRWNANAISSTFLPMRGTFKFRVNVRKTKNSRIMVGVAPSSFYKSGEDMYNKCGWFLYLYNGELYSQSQQAAKPHQSGGSNTNLTDGDSATTSVNSSSHSNPSYTASVTTMNLVSSGGWVEVVVDREEKTISFVVNGDSKGIAFKNVFGVDDDLCACVIFRDTGDSVQVCGVETLLS